MRSTALVCRLVAALLSAATLAHGRANVTSAIDVFWISDCTACTHRAEGLYILFAGGINQQLRL